MKFNYRQWLVACIVLMAAQLAYAEHREGGFRSRGYDGGGYYGPSVQPVLPTRPFFVKPYPQGSDDRGARGYRHGYREGYVDGFTDRDQLSRGSRYRRGDNRYDHYRDHRYGSPQGYYDSPYYGPRPGVSIYYRND